MNRNQKYIAKLLDNQASADRIRMADAAAAGAVRGVDAGISPIDPADLGELIKHNQDGAWRLLSTFTDEQLMMCAMEYTAWLNDRKGTDLQWAAVLARFETEIAKVATITLEELVEVTFGATGLTRRNPPQATTF